jgi:hypothetical protein
MTPGDCDNDLLKVERCAAERAFEGNGIDVSDIFVEGRGMGHGLIFLVAWGDAFASKVFRLGRAALCEQLANLGEMGVADRAVFDRAKALAWHRRAHAEIAAYRGEVRLSVASEMSCGSSHPSVAGMLAQPGECFAVVVVQDADKLVHCSTPV